MTPEAATAPAALVLAVLAFSAPLTVLLAVLSALFERSGHIRLHHWAEQAGGSLQATYQSPRHFEAFRFLISLCARLAPVACLWSFWTTLSVREINGAFWIAPSLVALLLAFVEWLNRLLVKVHAEQALRLARPIYRILLAFFRPFVWLLAPIVAFVEHVDEEEETVEVSEDEIDAFIDVGRREGILEAEQEDLVRSAVDFADIEVYSAMTPRVEVNAMPFDASYEQLAQKFLESRNSRLPIFRESIDQVIGILHIRDLFAAMHRGETTPIQELCQQPHFVPELKKLQELLEEMRGLHQQMAIVVDDYGGMAGLVTIEDIIEEIVGDIRDEHETKQDVRELLEDGRWRLTGRTYLQDLEELLDHHLDLDTLPYETISGLICGDRGYAPKPGEVVKTHGLAFTVESSDERRVKLVTVALIPAGELDSEMTASSA